MLDKIQVTVDNFGLINNGSFDLNGITVIKGGDFETLSDFNRILFANLISLSCEGDYASSSLFRSLLKETLGDESNLSLSVMIKFNRFINGWKDYDVSYKYLSKKFKKFKKLIPKGTDVDLTEIEEYLALYKGSKKYRLPVFSEMLKREFNTGKIDEYDDYEISLTIDEKYENFIRCKNMNREIGISYDLDVLPANVIYLDNDPIFDLEEVIESYYHYQELYSNMVDTQIECKSDTLPIVEMIEDINKGSFGNLFGFSFVDENRKMVEIEDIDNPAKHLGILQLLLDEGGIPEKSVLLINNIDDEMNDEYIKKTAEIIAKLALQLDLLVLIETQRDDFAEALKEHYDDLLLYNGFENDDGKFDFKLV